MAFRSNIESKFFFFEGQGGPLFAALHGPASDLFSGRPVLFVHSFGEELNKSRQLISLQAREFARHGFTTLLLDLPGCGDSYGELASVSWELWLGELELAMQWLHDRTGKQVCVWGLRMGALLGADLIERCDQVVGAALFWQPIHEGRALVNGLFRQLLASSIVQPGPARPSASDPRRQIANGENVEIGGYILTPGLVTDLERASLSDFASVDVPVYWIDISSRKIDRLSPASTKIIRNLEVHGVSVDAQVLRGDAFWSTVEIAECPALIEATIHKLT